MLYSIFLRNYSVTLYKSAFYKIKNMFRNVSKNFNRNFLFAYFEIISYLCTRISKIQ